MDDQTREELTDGEEAAILSAHAEMAAKRGNLPLLGACLESLSLPNPTFSPRELNRRIDESRNSHYAR